MLHDVVVGVVYGEYVGATELVVTPLLRENPPLLKEQQNP
jgi:hypothetical protein